MIFFKYKWIVTFDEEDMFASRMCLFACLVKVVAGAKLNR